MRERDVRKILVGDSNVEILLVIAHNDIKFWMPPLDQLRLQNERLDIGRRLLPAD